MAQQSAQDKAVLYGLSRLRAGLQKLITWFQGSTPLGSFTSIKLGTNLTGTASGDTLTIDASGGGGSGTVINVSAGNLNPLFTTNITNPTTTPDLQFTVVNQNANLFYAGPSSGAAAAPTFRAITTTDLPAISAVRGPGCIFSNGNLTLTGTLTDEIQIPFGGTITDWTIVGNTTGSASIIVSHATYANYDTMTTLFTATCTSAKKATATGLSHSVAAGDILRFSGSGFSGFTRCSITLTVR